MQVMNVVKRVDGNAGSRYLLELKVKDENGRQLRLAHYIYVGVKPTLINNSGRQDTQLANQPVMCNPVGLEWNPAAVVNIVVTGTASV